MHQILQLHDDYDTLQIRYGDPDLLPIYGAGDINNPEVMFIFMNPTGRNIASYPDWDGIRAPWIGTKQVWNLFHELELLNTPLYSQIQNLKPDDWSVEFAEMVYKDIANHSTFITNLAKCTQKDARPLSNSIFSNYLHLMYKEIEIVNPKKIISFGNQVSSILLDKSISVSNFQNMEKENLNGYDIYPTYYPVGQGRRNLPLAIKRLQNILFK